MLLLPEASARKIDRVYDYPLTAHDAFYAVLPAVTNASGKKHAMTEMTVEAPDPNDTKS